MHFNQMRSDASDQSQLEVLIDLGRLRLSSSSFSMTIMIPLEEVHGTGCPGNVGLWGTPPRDIWAFGKNLGVGFIHVTQEPHVP